MKKTVTSLAVAALATGVFGAANADYPERPINLIVPYKAGGGTDAYARALVANSDGTLDVPIVVVNKAGSSGLIGANNVARARNDGYTLLLTSSGSLLLTTMTREGPNPLEEFEVIAQVGELKSGLAVPAGSPYQTARELVDAMRANPGKLRWGHTGRGGVHNMAGLGFLRAQNVIAQDVPFKGGAPLRAALIGGQVDFGFIGIQQVRGYEDKMRALAVNSVKRDAVMTEVPSFDELGLEFADISSPVILFAPKGTDAGVIKTMQSAARQISAKPGFAALLNKRGSAVVYADGKDAHAKLAAMQKAAKPLVAAVKAGQ